MHRYSYARTRLSVNNPARAVVLDRPKPSFLTVKTNVYISRKILRDFLAT